MNELVAQLAEQAGQESFYSDNDLVLRVSSGDKEYDVPAKFIERFAEILIEQCAGLTLDYKNEDHYQGWLDHQEEILKHFGVTYED